MDYITDYIVNDISILDIPNNISYNLYNNLIYQTHIYIVNNLNYNNYAEPTLSALQYFNIMCFLDEIS